MTTPAGQVLRRAAEIVDGARNETHGDKEHSFNDIASRWSYTLGGVPISGSTVALMMVRLKEARLQHGNSTAVTEHIEDILGYWAIHYELLQCEAMQPAQKD